MEANRLFYSDQYGFRPGHSTEPVSVRFVNDLIQQIDTFNIPISILIDLSKAFDTLDHKFMLSKLRYYGISGVELNFFHISYQKEYNTSITLVSDQDLYLLQWEYPRIYLGVTPIFDIYQ